MEITKPIQKMNSTNNLFHLFCSIAKIREHPAVLWRTVLAFLLISTLPQAALGDQSTNATKATNNSSSIAVFRLEGKLTEAPVDEAFPMFNLPGTSLKELVTRLDKAAHDANVKAVVILPDNASFGFAQVEELRGAMSRVRSVGKEVYVHADSLMMAQYVLACGATRISVVPTGAVLIPGLDGSSLHVRGLLDKIGVKPDFITEGAYKSAAELFMREEPSPQADEMMNWLMDGWYASLSDLIATGRKADADKVKGWLDNGLFTATQAKTSGVIDAVEQQQDFEAMLKDRYGKDIVFDKKYGREHQTDIDFSSPFAFLKIWGELLGASPKKRWANPQLVLSM